MKAHLMFADRDVDLGEPTVPQAEDLIGDLGLTTLFQAMAGTDEFLDEVAQKVVLTSLTNVDQILYRQRALADCLEHPQVVREIFTLATETLKIQKGIFGGLTGYPSSILSHSIGALEQFVPALRRLRFLAEDGASSFHSPAFTTLFRMLSHELSEDYFDAIGAHLKRLQFRGGVLMSATLGKGNKASDYVLREAPPHVPFWRRLVSRRGETAYSFEIPDRDDSGAQALSQLRGRGINLVADALAQSTDHIHNFFEHLRTELAFYVGCLNLVEHLAEREGKWVFPEPRESGAPVLHSRGLYDVVLRLLSQGSVVGNDLLADATSLVMITGANEGGKSTLLRAVGLAELMMHCGMPVCAESFASSVCSGVFTHFTREEDSTMTKGKLEEELARMRDLAGVLKPGSLVLFNESFSSTNEREGSEIARHIIRALVASDVRVLFVTHLYELAQGFYAQQSAGNLFLRAERQADGVRTFRLVEGEPLPTSFGGDLYQKIFADSVDTPA